MRVSIRSALCDAIEIGVLQLGKPLSPDDVIKEAMQGMDLADARVLVADAFTVAVDRSSACPNQYPFEATPRIIKPKSYTGWNPYLFLLFGCSATHGGVANTAALNRDFRKYFEDAVCWSLRQHGFLAEVLSQPRAERGLPKPLKPALREVAKCFGEQCELIEEKVTSEDNDLGVDVIATMRSVDLKRSGRPVFLFQCLAGDVINLGPKMAEDFTLFPKIWNWGFYERSSIRGGATPYDLGYIEKVHWDRLSEYGWVLDRMRLVAMAESAGAGTQSSKGLQQLWTDFLAAVPNFDWRNAWQYAL